jgi:hypothetical protein
MKLIRSMPGVPSATPAQDSSSVHRSAALIDGAVDRRLFGQVDVDRLGPGQ